MAQPTLKLALKMSDGSSTCRHHWEWKSVKAKKLNADFLPTPNVSKIDKNTDYALTMQTSTDPAIEKIQERMGFKKNCGQDQPTLSHIFPTDLLSILPLFSGVKVKRASGEGLLSGTILHNKYYDCAALLSYLKEQPFVDRASFIRAFAVHGYGTRIREPDGLQLHYLQLLLLGNMIYRPPST